MTTPESGPTNDYLWDPESSPAPEVTEVERMLEPLKFDPAAKPLVLPAQPVVHARRWRWTYSLAAAAVVFVAIGWAVSTWKWSWPEGRAWTVNTWAGGRTSGTTTGAPGRLAVGSALDLPETASARVDIARIGTMEIEGGARVMLRYTQGTRHRLTLERGTVRVRTWAPPGSVQFQTPAGEVIDMGCEFDLTAEPARTILRVRSGWVQLENGFAEVLIPAGASTEMRSDRAPGVAVYDDARPEFASAIRALETGAGDRSAHLGVVASSARARDVYTLLTLAARNEPGSDRLLTAAADLWPPPAGVTVSGILRGDRDALWRWRETLPLPPAKSWLRNWRDGLPEWLIGRD
jgi:hypothetical protein